MMKIIAEVSSDQKGVLMYRITSQMQISSVRIMGMHTEDSE